YPIKQLPDSCVHVSFVRGPGDVRLTKCGPHAFDFACAGPELTTPDCRYDPLEHDARKKFCRRVLAPELVDVIQISKVHVGKNSAQRIGCPPDVDDDPVAIDYPPPKFHVDDVGGAVRALRRPERLTFEAVGDHEVISHANCVHRLLTLESGIGKSGNWNCSIDKFNPAI